ncbi:hypothetical protein LTR94_029722, partial [Friedmanniomyces endolithicus]
MLAVALNLSGVFHVGAGLQGAGHGPLSRLPGAAGAFFTGVLAVIVAAPCTAPFMAFALGAALFMPWPMALAVFLMLGLGLALPYVLISLNPRLLARLPKPGPWMETLRNLLAFPMYGAALWLAWVYGRQTADALALLFGAGLMLALALWLYGRAQVAAPGKSRIAGIAALLALIAALGPRFPEQATRDPEEFDRLNRAYADAMRVFYQQFSDDIDAAALFGDALICLSPRALWDLDTGEPIGPGTLEARA